jgi:hypothetical protein
MFVLWRGLLTGSPEAGKRGYQYGNENENLQPVAAMPNFRWVRHYHLRWFRILDNFHPEGNRPQRGIRFATPRKLAAPPYFDAGMRFSL